MVLLGLVGLGRAFALLGEDDGEPVLIVRAVAPWPVALQAPAGHQQQVASSRFASRITYHRGTLDPLYASPVKLRRDAPLHRSREFRIGVGVPAPLSARLDGLVELADQEGARTSRKELLAAVLLAAPAEGRSLAGLVRDYRMANVGEAVIDGQPEERFLEPDRPAPGPRPRRLE
jgi:hypothetical protein